VLFTEVAAKLDYPDGGRHLVGLDGVTVPIEPTLYALSHKVLARLDARVLLDRTVPMPARSPDVIPYPSSRPLATATRANRRRMSPDERWVFVASTVLTVLLAACTGVVAFGTESELAGVGIVITVGAATALYAWHRKRR
jgi:zinc protease